MGGRNVGGLRGSGRGDYGLDSTQIHCIYAQIIKNESKNLNEGCRTLDVWFIPGLSRNRLQKKLICKYELKAIKFWILFNRCFVNT